MPGPVQASLYTHAFQAVQVQHSATDNTAVQPSIWLVAASSINVLGAVFVKNSVKCPHKTTKSSSQGQRSNRVRTKKGQTNFTYLNIGCTKFQSL